MPAGRRDAGAGLSSLKSRLKTILDLESGILREYEEGNRTEGTPRPQLRRSKAAKECLAKGDGTRPQRAHPLHPPSTVGPPEKHKN